MAFKGVEDATGIIRVGGRDAAAFVNASWKPDDADKGVGAGWAVYADLTRWNDVWLRGRGPFELRLFLRNSTWRWKGVAVTYERLDGNRARCAVTGAGEPESLPPTRPTATT